MAKTPKRPRDPNQLAKLIVDLATGQEQPPSVVSDTHRRAGLKGAESRAASLTERRRSEIATAAAKARWAKKD